MAKKRKFTNEIIVGAAILIAIAVAIYGYVFLREIPVRQHGFHVYMVFSDITGLEKGDAVTVSGLKVGRVQEMKLTKGFVKVKTWLNGSIPFPKDSRAAIRSIGMIGEKYIDLQPGHSSEMLAEGDVIQGSYISDIADMGGPVSKMITQLNSLLTKFNTAMDSAFGAQTQRHFAETLEHTRNISYQMQLSMQKNLDHFQNVLTSFDTLSTSLKNYWQNNQKAIGQTTENVSAMAVQLRHTLTKID
ncbi:MAG: MCE family protein, partial [Calditrichaeota bacterium]